jgi:hypothetical protein
LGFPFLTLGERQHGLFMGLPLWVRYRIGPYGPGPQTGLRCHSLRPAAAGHSLHPAPAPAACPTVGELLFLLSVFRYADLFIRWLWRSVVPVCFFRLMGQVSEVRAVQAIPFKVRLFPLSGYRSDFRVEGTLTDGYKKRGRDPGRGKGGGKPGRGLAP